MTPDQVAAVAVAWIGAVIVIVGALGALAVKVLQNARDIKAAWAQLRRHEAALNGAVKSTEEHGER